MLLLQFMFTLLQILQWMITSPLIVNSSFKNPCRTDEALDREVSWVKENMQSLIKFNWL